MSDLHQTTVFLIDDSVTDRTRGVGLIRRIHPEWEVTGFSEARDALDAISERPPTVVISDLMMPEMDGRQLLTRMEESHPTIPVILITAQGSDEIAAECLSLGAVNYVPKRVLAEQLIPAVEHVVAAEMEVADVRRVFESMVSNECEFEIENQLEQIRTLVNFIRKRLHTVNLLDVGEIRQVTAATREALMNGYFHGNLRVNENPLQHPRKDYLAIASERPLETGHLRLSMSLTPEDVTVRVEDDGDGFDAAFLEELTGPPDSGFPNGNGVRIMRSSVDSVTWNDRGNAVTLVKKIRSGSHP